MKNTIIRSFKIVLFLVCVTILGISCEYEDYAEADYPDQMLYMPAAINGLFVIDALPERVDFLPTPGMAYDFEVNESANKFIVPLSIYRAGIERSGKVTVTIAVENDTLNDLISAGTLSSSVGVLPSAEYSLPSSVDIADGDELGVFNLEIDLDFLKSNPDTVLAVVVGISSSTAVNPKYDKTVIVIHTHILIPETAFSFTKNAKTEHNIQFRQSIAFSLKDSWKFGNDAKYFSDNPFHECFTTGVYQTTPPDIGLPGTPNKQIFSLPVRIT